MSAQPSEKASAAISPAMSLLQRQWTGAAASNLPAELWQRVLLSPVQEILSRPGKAFRGHLVQAAWKLMDRDDEAPVELEALIEILHAGSMVVDDIEDGSITRRGGPAIHTLYGVPVALNAGNWMYFWPFEVLRGLKLSPELELLLTNRMLTTLCACHRGQALDVAVHVGDIVQGQVRAVVAETTVLKTGALMGLAAALGGAAAGARGKTLEALERFGTSLGVALQKLDDLGNLNGGKDPDKRYEDLKNGRLGWPWAWAADSLEPDAFDKLVAVAKDVHANAGAHDGGVEWLAARLKAVAGAERRSAIATELTVSLRGVESVFGRNATTAFLRQEVARLEASYG